MPKGSVKIMLSYDYCHFEVCLGSDENLSLDQINEMRKDAQRLADRAVNQYKTAKKYEQIKLALEREYKRLEREVETIKKDIPEGERRI